MAGNNIKLNELIGEVDKLNKSLAETATRIKEILEAQKVASKELNTVKGLTETNSKLNQVKQSQNQIEKEGEKLLAQRNALVAKQDESLKALTRDTIKQREAAKAHADQIKAEGNAYKQLSLRHKESLENAKKLAAQYGVNSKQAKAAASEANKYGNQLKDIDKSLGNNQRNVGNYGTAIKSFIGTIGLATGGVALLKKAFDGVVGGSQSAGDAWARTMGSMTAATKTFFSMVGTGDFVNFTGRLKEAIKAGREYADALDDLFEGGLGLEIAEAKAKKAIVLQEQIRDNVQLTLEERKAAAIEINRLEEEILDKRIFEAGKEYEAHAKYIEGINGLDRDKLINFIENYRQEEVLRNEALAKRAKEAELYEKAYIQFVGADGRIVSQVDQTALRVYEAFKKTYTDQEKIYLAFYDKYQGSSDETINNVIKSYAKMTSLEAESLEGRKRNNIKYNNFVNDSKKKEVVKAIDYKEELIESEEGIFDGLSSIHKKELDEKNNINKEKAQSDKEYADYLNQLTDETEKNTLESWDKQVSQRELYNQKRFELEQALNDQQWEMASTAVNALFDLAQSRNERELQGLRSTYAARIEAAEGNQELQDKLAKELEQKEMEMQIRQAKSERNQQLFNLAITTAQRAFEIKAQAAVLAANPLTAPLAGLALSQLSFLLGSSAITAGLILAQPLPGFFTGTENAPAGLAWVAEHGAELIQARDGSTYLAKEKQLVNLQGGEKINTAAETSRMLNSAIMNDIAVNGNGGIESRLDAMVKEMKNLKQVNVNFDAQGMHVYSIKGKSITKYLNSKVRK